MQEDFTVFLENVPAGRIQVHRQGLYYYFHCRCRLPGDGMYRLFARCGENEENLGVLVPVDHVFGLDTRIPVKRLGESAKMEFCLIPKCAEKPQNRFVPICPEEPFGYLPSLKDAYLARRGNRYGAMIQNEQDSADHSSISKLTGQWSEPKMSE